MTRTKTLAAAVLAFSMFATGLVQATPILHTLTLTQNSPSAENFVGTFSIDDSLLTANTQINFSDFLSFSITTAGLTWDLLNSVIPANEGVITNASGVVTNFNDTVGGLTEFCIGGCGTFLRFTNGTNNYDTFGGPPGSTLGTYSISVTSSVPEPASLALLGLGLFGLGFSKRNKI